MAAELVGGAFLSAFLQVTSKTTSMEGNSWMRCSKVLEDAEEKQYRSPNVMKWLDELKEAIYEAELLLGEVATEASRQNLEAEFQPATSKVRGFFMALINPFDKEIASRVKELLENINFLAEQMDVVGLRKGICAGIEVGNSPKDCQLHPWWMNPPYVVERVPVVSIVGMGGIGKTTLAQLVYNDQTVQDQFDLKAWVYVSQDFDVVALTIAILKQRLMGKKFLLVLDDVWNENYSSWEALQIPFIYGFSGSRILITTRNEKPLEKEDCWKLFATLAFHDKDACKYSNLVSVGSKIVDKCGGLPLAIRTLGNVLQAKFSQHEWVEFDKDQLIQLWMAEGLLNFWQINKSEEELGAEFFNDLVARSFFQQSRRHGSHFTMHDLLNDLAKSILGDFCLQIDRSFEKDITKRTCHISCSHKFNLDDTFLEHICNCLLTELVDDISNLNLLHYLDLSYTKIKRLPDSICMLHNLLTLLLIWCYHLTELPLDLHKLVNLRHLDVRMSGINKMPNHIGSLKHLQTLDRTLSIFKLENVTDPTNAMEANKKDKKHLEGLVLDWGDKFGRSNENEDKIVEGHVLESLHPNEVIGPEFCSNDSSHVSFRSLEILKFKEMSAWKEWCNFEGEAFYKALSWVEKKLVIYECQHLEDSVPKAASIHKLELRRCETIFLKDSPSSLKRASIQGTHLIESCLEQIMLNNAEIGNL
ncbi:putative disease resistance RPP13-like protein 1 [Glycine soja]|uniref:Putative disease resistance RPP13-like protein 1 n=1 Tax=Glycine soja TaxID=3848 RepID=A0A445I3Q6_GLYSO|nr:putative disease resistance RPP13-like protein 1 [Glycine soja]